MNEQPGRNVRLRGIAWRLLAIGFTGLALVTVPGIALSETQDLATPASIDSTVEAGDADAEQPRRRMVKWNEYDGPITSVRLGFGFLFDGAMFWQDDESKQQFNMVPDVGVRDSRLLLSGRFKTKRSISWTIGYMYDSKEDDWFFRKTGVLFDVPELSGRIFIGRNKEGYSMVKVMNGYHPWLMERTNILDLVPILADGVMWQGYFPKSKLHVDLGIFTDELSEKEKFATYDNQVVSRVVWTPVLSEKERKVLHLGVSGRTGNVDNDTLQIRSKPEMNLAPYFVDTGKIPAGHATGAGIEAFYRTGPWLFGTEQHWQTVEAKTGESPTFNGGNFVVVLLFGAETRGYNAAGGFFNAVSPKKTIHERGPGAIETVLNFSYINLNSGSFQGGKLWRLTPQVSWYISDNVRFELNYGYAVSDRLGLEGKTQFLQFRIQTFL